VIPTKLEAAAAASLPSLVSVLNLPATIGGVSSSALLTVLEQGLKDIPKIIDELRTAGFLPADELAVDDALALAGIVGVPGVTLASTIVPYLFDLLNAEISSGGRVTVQAFVNTLDIAKTNLGAIVIDLANRDYIDAGEMEVSDVLSIVAAAFPGPIAAIVQIVVKAAFALARSEGDPLGFAKVFGIVGQMTADLGEIVDELEGIPVMSADGRYQYSPLQGWVPYVPISHTALRYDGRKKSEPPKGEDT